MLKFNFNGNSKNQKNGEIYNIIIYLSELKAGYLLRLYYPVIHKIFLLKK